MNMRFPPIKPLHVYLFSAIALLILAYFSIGYLHPDEHFQILEFAAWKLNLTTPDKLPWEFHFQIRPSIQPAIVVATHNLFALFDCRNPFFITFFLRILSAVLSFTAMWMIYRNYSGGIRDKVFQKWFLFLSFLLWFALYNNVRFTSEAWSGSIFIIGFSYLFLQKRELFWLDYFITGILLGLSFVFRFQAGLLIAGLFCWLLFIKKEKLLYLTLLAIGIAGAILLGFILDRWFYGNWVFTAWNYFQQNILADKLSGFGIQPWWFYFEDVFIRAVPPFSIVFILAFILVFIFLRKDVLTWTLLPFVLFHFLMGHKETRFFWPIIGFIPILVIKASELVQNQWNVNISGNRYFSGFVKIFMYCNILMLFIVFFNPADSQVKVYKAVYDQYPDPITLYYINEDPYYRAKEIHYYKRENLEIKKAQLRVNLDSSNRKKYLIAVRGTDPELSLFKDHKLVYASYPEWMKRFNINHWLDRTKIWYVYEDGN
jgi:phosphatidylinositol glycan class B